MEWDCVFKRYLTAEEKEFITSVVDKNKDKIIIDRQSIPKLWKDSLSKEDAEELTKILKDILYDFVAFDFFVVKEKISVRMSKKWDRMFTGCCYVPLKSLLEDKILLYTECSDNELETHIINKTSELRQYIGQYRFNQIKETLK